LTGHDGRVYASLGRRVAAYVLDIAVATSVVILVGFVLMISRAVGVWIPAAADATPEETWHTLEFVPKLFVFFAFVLSMGPVYFTLCEASAWQATFGKRLLNIYVTDDGGTRITAARSLGRWIVKWISSWFLLILVSVITIAVTKERKGIHDLFANTLVLRGRPVQGGGLEPWRIAVGLGLPFVWLLGTFLATL
jgi:uncharacterized RDD family membrane protein YckC